MPALKPLPATLALAAILVLGSTAALLYTGTSRAADEAPADTARPALTVSTAQPQRGAVPLRLAANGNVAAWQEASIGAESQRPARGRGAWPTSATWSSAASCWPRFAAESVQADVAQARASLAEAQANAAEADRQRRARPRGAGHGRHQRAADQPVPTAGQTAQGPRGGRPRPSCDAQQLRLKNTQRAGARQRRHLGPHRHRGRGGGRRHRAVPPDAPGPPGVARRGHLHRAGAHPARHHGA